MSSGDHARFIYSQILEKVGIVISSPVRKYFIKTFGCQMNTADSERIATAYAARGFVAAKGLEEAGHVIINTCMVRQSAENRIYGLVRNLSGWKEKKEGRKIILTGCLVGLAVREKTGRILNELREKLPLVDEFLPISEVGFDLTPLRTEKVHAWVPISSGCNNYCTYCVVPYTRGLEVSRPFAEVLAECRKLADGGYRAVTLLGQNVNSYGTDLIEVKSASKNSKPLFPRLLGEVVQMGFARVNFISANPWDFSPELIEVIARYPNISREVHLPLQSGDDEILRKMNRAYSRDQYLQLVADLRSRIYDLGLTTDIIVGFPGETEEQFQNTVDLCRRVGFAKAYIAMYSPRPQTVAQKAMTDNVPYAEKKRRWQVLEDLINRHHKASRT